MPLFFWNMSVNIPVESQQPPLLRTVCTLSSGSKFFRHSVRGSVRGLARGSAPPWGPFPLGDGGRLRHRLALSLAGAHVGFRCPRVHSRRCVRRPALAPPCCWGEPLLFIPRTKAELSGPRRGQARPDQTTAGS